MMSLQSIMTSALEALNADGYHAEAGKYGVMPDIAPAAWLYLEPQEAEISSAGEPFAYHISLQLFILESGAPNAQMDAALSAVQKAMDAIPILMAALDEYQPAADDKPVSFDAWYGDYAVAAAHLTLIIR